MPTRIDVMTSSAETAILILELLVFVSYDSMRLCNFMNITGSGQKEQVSTPHLACVIAFRHEDFILNNVQ
jgi:hypothetical protein